MPKQRTAKDREQHLYLVLDDWYSGYSIRKVSLSRRSGKRRSGEGVVPLPGAFMRIREPRGFPKYIAAAFGTRIMVMYPSIDIPGIPMIDVEELSFDYGPEPSFSAVPIYLPVGDNKLFALCFATFHCYLWMPEHSEPRGRKDLSFPPFGRVDVSSYGVQPDGCILVSTRVSLTDQSGQTGRVRYRYTGPVWPETG
jgi:hypothetical protein